MRASCALVPANASLEQVVVHGMPVAPRLMEFELRRALGLGQFMTEADISKLNFAGTSDLLRTFRSVVVGRTAVLNSATCRFAVVDFVSALPPTRRRVPSLRRAPRARRA